MLGLSEVDIAADQDIPEPGSPRQLERPVQVLGCAFMARPIAATIDQKYRFARVGQ